MAPCGSPIKVGPHGMNGINSPLAYKKQDDGEVDGLSVDDFDSD